MKLLVLVAALLLTGLAPALAQRLVTQTATPAAGQPLVLELKYAHAIRVRPGTGPGVTVQARVTIANDELNQSYALVVAQPLDNELRIEEKLDDQLIRRYIWHEWRDGEGHHGRGDDTALRIDYEVTLPAATDLTIRTVPATIDAEDLSGRVTLKTISGDLNLSNLRGAVLARTISGSIRLRGLPGTAPVDAITVSGDVDANWPPARQAELSLKSISGEVYADPTVTFSNLKPRRYVGYELHGQVAGGSGPLVSLHTVSGNVFFRQQ